MLSRWLAPGWRGQLLAVIAGAVTPLSLAPYNLWPVAILSLALLGAGLQNMGARQATVRAWCFGLGLFGSGASWVYVSIHNFGYAPVWLALLLTFLFVAGLALVFALPYYLYGRHFNSRPLGLLLAFPALWVLGEWLRSWLLTGFPWLYVGYGHLESPLAGWAPVGGVFSVSLIVALSAAALAACWQPLLQSRLKAREQSRLKARGQSRLKIQGKNQPSDHNPYGSRPALIAVALCLSLWLGGWGLSKIEWTQPKGDVISVGLVQANIPQELKWEPHYLQPTLERYRTLSEPLWQHDWLIWPEAAIPLLYHQAGPFLSEIQVRAASSNTALITGILYDTPRDISGQQQYHNSLLGLGRALGIYHKRRLVPFGEYVPLEQWLRGLISFFNLPTSIITAGPDKQRGLQIGALQLVPFICYEVVYPDLVAAGAAEADVLLTVSNDAWFGDSLGPLQHLQMAQMRALETGRYMIRGTNNGISGIANPRGELTLESQQFVQQSLSGEVQAMTGLTPFVRLGSWPVILLCGVLLAVSYYRRKA